jgi:hypothetical protein
VNAVSHVTDAQGRFTPGPDRCSIEECVEHLAVVEAGIVKRVSEQTDRAPGLVGSRDLESRRALLERTKKRLAPERLRPTGRFGSLSAALTEFVSRRRQTLDFVATCDHDLRARSVRLPIGSMSCHEFMVHT